MATIQRAEQMALAQLAASGDVAKLRDGIADIVDAGDPKKVRTWAYFASKFGDWIDAGMPEDTPFAVWSLEGNIKLPFASFSAAPVVTCPGAGACALDGWCYSFKCWRYPAAFLRQLQNTLLLTKSAGRRIVAKKTNELPTDIDCRLYVDGDFATLAQVAFWMSAINSRSDLRVYGYSKSWRQLLEYDKIGGVWPENYCLNLSNGGNAEHLRGDVARLPIVRGNFLTVDIARRLAGKYGTTAYKAAVRESAANAGIKRPFICPGKCGECTPKGHFCGRPETSGVDVVIGVH